MHGKRRLLLTVMLFLAFCISGYRLAVSYEDSRWDEEDAW